MALRVPEGRPVYTTQYSNFLGVDYSAPAETIYRGRFSDCNNLVFDTSGLIEKRPGFECIGELNGEIHSMKSVSINGKNELLIHAGSKLYKYDGNTVAPIKKEGYKRYSYLITLPRLVGSHETYGSITSRKVGFDITYNSNSYKMKEMFMVKVSALPWVNDTHGGGKYTTHYGKTPEEIKSILDSKTYSEIEEYYRNIIKTNPYDAEYTVSYSPEHYYNQIKNGNFESDKEGLDKYENGDYEIFANSMSVSGWNGNGCIYQHIPVKSTEESDLFYKSVFYVTFLASEGFENNIVFFEDTCWSKAQPNPETMRTYCNSVGVDNVMSYDGEKNKLTGGELAGYNSTGLDTDIGNGKSSMDVYNNKVWITTQNGIFVYDGIHVMEAEKFAFAPVTTALRNMNYTYNKNDAGGVSETTDTEPGMALESVNLLTRKRVNTFALSHFCTGHSLSNNIYEQYSDITLDADIASVERVEVLTASGTYEEVDKMFYYPHSRNKIRIKLQHYSGNSHGNRMQLKVNGPYILDGVTENLRVHFTATTPSGYEKKVDKCHITTVFGIGKDDRLFLTGNGKYPNYIWYSDFENFAYIPDINYIVAGDGNTEVLGFTKVNEHLLVHKEGNNQDTTVFLVSGSLDSSGTAVFTVIQGINGVGAVSEKGFVNFDDVPMYLSDKGIYNVLSTNIVSEKTVANRSGYINSKLLKCNLKEAVLFSYDDMVLCSAGDDVFVIYPRKQSFYGKDNLHMETSFECLKWSIPGVQIRIFGEYDGKLFFGTKDGRMFKWRNDTDSITRFNDKLTLNGEERAVECYFITKLDSDGSFMTLKTMVKRGCGICLKPFAQSSVEVFVLTEKDHAKMIKYSGAAFLDFSEFNFGIVDFSTRDTGRIIPFNAKVKKYAALSFKVQNRNPSQGFGVIGIEKRFTMGNYKKY